MEVRPIKSFYPERYWWVESTLTPQTTNDMHKNLLSQLHSKKGQMWAAAEKTARVQDAPKLEVSPLRDDGLLEENQGASDGGFLKARMLKDVLLMCSTLTRSK